MSSSAPDNDYDSLAKSFGINLSPSISAPPTGRAQSLQSAADKLGVDPVDLGSIISFESGGSFNPHKVGGAGNQYRGLIQFGPAEQRKYYHPNDTFDSQLQNGVVPYFQDRFRKAGRNTNGASLEDLYTAVIAGNPGANRNTKDAFGTSARSGTQRILNEHRPKVLQNIFGGQEPGRSQTDYDALSQHFFGAGKPQTNTDYDALDQHFGFTSDAPVPELPATLDAQRQASHDPRSTRVGILYTPGEALPQIDATTEMDIPIPGGQTLRVNRQKFIDYNALTGTTVADLQNGADFTPLIGGKAQPTPGIGSTAPIAVHTTDAQGTELNSSGVIDPTQVPVQAALDRLAFPNQDIQTSVVPSDEVTAKRMLDQMRQNEPIPTTDTRQVSHLTPQPQPQVPLQPASGATPTQKAAVPLPTAVPQRKGVAPVQAAPQVQRTQNVPVTRQPEVTAVPIDDLLKSKDIDRELFTRSIAPIAARNNIDADRVKAFTDSLNGQYFKGEPYTKEELEYNKSKGRTVVHGNVEPETVSALLKFSGLTSTPNDTAERQKAEALAAPTDEAYRQKAIEELTNEKRTEGLNRFDRDAPESSVQNLNLTEDEIQKRIAEFKAQELSPEAKSRAYDVAQKNAGMPGSFLSGLYGGAGSVIHTAAGVLRPFSAVGIPSGYESLSEIGKEMQSVSQYRNEGKGSKNAGESIAGFAGESIPQLAEMIALPGGAIGKFAFLGAAKASGAGAPVSEVGKGTVEGALTGKAFKVAEGLQNPLARLGTVFGGSMVANTAIGVPLDQSAHRAILNTMFQAVGDYGPKVLDKTYRFWKGGDPVDVGLTDKGEVLLDSVDPDRHIDGEIVLDPKNDVYNQPKASFKGSTTETLKPIDTQTPEALEQQRVDALRFPKAKQSQADTEAEIRQSTAEVEKQQEASIPKERITSEQMGFAKKASPTIHDIADEIDIDSSRVQANIDRYGVDGAKVTTDKPFESLPDRMLNEAISEIYNQAREVRFGPRKTKEEIAANIAKLAEGAKSTEGESAPPLAKETPRILKEGDEFSTEGGTWRVKQINDDGSIEATGGMVSGSVTLHEGSLAYYGLTTEPKPSVPPAKESAAAEGKEETPTIVQGSKVIHRGKEYEVAAVNTNGDRVMLRDPSTKTGRREVSSQSVLLTEQASEHPAATTARPETGAGKQKSKSKPPRILSLSQFVRAQGGIKATKWDRGEVKRLSNKETGTTGLINKNGTTAEYMAESAWEAGYLRDHWADIQDRNGDEFMGHVEDDLHGIRKHYPMEAHEEFDRHIADQEKEYYEQKAASEADIEKYRNEKEAIVKKQVNLLADPEAQDILAKVADKGYSVKWNGLFDDPQNEESRQYQNLLEKHGINADQHAANILDAYKADRASKEGIAGSSDNPSQRGAPGANEKGQVTTFDQTDLFGRKTTPQTSQPEMFDTAKLEAESKAASAKELSDAYGKRTATYIGQLERSPNPKVAMVAKELRSQAKAVAAKGAESKELVEASANALDLFTRAEQTKRDVSEAMKQGRLDGVAYTPQEVELAKAMESGAFPRVFRDAVSEAKTLPSRILSDATDADLAPHLENVDPVQLSKDLIAEDEKNVQSDQTSSNIDTRTPESSTELKNPESNQSRADQAAEPKSGNAQTPAAEPRPAAAAEAGKAEQGSTSVPEQRGGKAERELAYQAAKNVLRQKLGKDPTTFGAGVPHLDTETIKALTTIANYHIENGITKFNELVDKAAEELGIAADKIRPHLEEMFPAMAERGKERSLPKTLEAAQLEKGKNLTYAPESIKNGIERGRQIIAEKGLEGAKEFVRNGNGIEWAPTGFAVMEHQRNEINRTTDPKESARLYKEHQDFVSDFADEATKRGQSIVSVKAVEEFTPDRAAYILNKASQRGRGRPVSRYEENKVTEIATELERERNRAAGLEQQLTEANKRLESKAPRAKKETYLDRLEQASESAKQDILSRLKTLDLSGLKKEKVFEGERGAIGEKKALPGDAELLAQYAAGRLHKVESVDVLNKELTDIGGDEVQDFLPQIRRRAYELRQEARIEELEAKDTTKERRESVIQEIKKEVAAANKAEVNILKQFRKEQVTEARTQTKEAKAAQRASDKALADEARQQAKQFKRNLIDARKAQEKGFRESIKAKRQAEKEAAFWDTPVRNMADEARTRLADANPTDPNTIINLASVGAEKFLRDNKGGVPGKRAISPSQFYRDIKAEFPDLVTDKNQGEIYKQSYQRIQDVVNASRDKAKLSSASKEVQKLWENEGVDADTQALLVQKSANARRQMELRSAMAHEFARVSEPKYKTIAKEIINAPRSMMTSLNIHQGRQGLFTLLTNPDISFRVSVPASVRGFRASKPDFLRLTEELKASPGYGLAEQSGLNFAELPKSSTDEKGHIEEDQLRSTWAMKLPWVRKSTQGFILGMNAERLALFNRWASIGEADGYTFESNPKFFQDAASVANDFTGRGAAPEVIEQVIKKTNQLFFAPRLKVSQVKAINDMFNPMVYFGKNAYDPVMRKIMFKTALRTVAGFSVAYGTLIALGGKSSNDPEDPDFGKVRFGHTHYDLTGGAGATFKFAYNFLRSVGGYIAGEKQDEYHQPLSLAESFFRKKLAPWPGAFLDYFTGKNAVGQPSNLTIQSPEKMMKQNIVLKMVLPLIVNEVVDGLEDDGWRGVAKTGPASLFGITEQTYSPSVFAADKQLKDAQKSGNVQDIQQAQKDLQKARELKQEKKLETQQKKFANPTPRKPKFSFR